MEARSEQDLAARIISAFASRPRPSESEVLRSEACDDDGAPLRALLAARTPTELSAHEIRTVVEGNLSLLAPRAFLCFLPAFLVAALRSYGAVSVFASELIGALTEPSRTDVVEAFDRLGQSPPGLGLPEGAGEFVRLQQLDWFDSGVPTTLFRERFDAVSTAEGAAIHAFLLAFKEAHGEDFPFDEIDTAIERHWGRFPVP